MVAKAFTWLYLAALFFFGTHGWQLDSSLLFALASEREADVSLGTADGPEHVKSVDRILGEENEASTEQMHVSANGDIGSEVKPEVIHSETADTDEDATLLESSKKSFVYNILSEIHPQVLQETWYGQWILRVAVTLALMIFHHFATTTTSSGRIAKPESTIPRAPVRVTPIHEQRDGNDKALDHTTAAVETPLSEGAQVSNESGLDDADMRGVEENRHSETGVTKSEGAPLSNTLGSSTSIVSSNPSESSSFADPKVNTEDRPKVAERNVSSSTTAQELPGSSDADTNRFHNTTHDLPPLDMFWHWCDVEACKNLHQTAFPVLYFRASSLTRRIFFRFCSP
jgi:hypothetical protein